jgi:4-amino-4-deoxy-L-arabinose transferase-like glycosyltransferase
LNTHTEIAYKRWTVFYIFAFCLVWWALFSISRHYLDGADMVENYAWGQEWRWGNNKHPPLFGWIVAAWFSVFPTTDWAYYLLNEFNLGVALILLAMAMGRLLSPEKVLAAIILTSLGSHFGPDSGYKYNANTAQLPFIAGFVWSMLHATESRRPLWFITAGVFGAAAILTKYYALVLFLAIGLGLLISMRLPLRELLKGLAITAITALLLVSPHILWSIQHDWPSLHYMHTAHETTDGITGIDSYVVAITGLSLFGVVALLAWGGSLMRLPVSTFDAERKPRLGLTILILSVVLTLLAAWVQKIEPVSSWFIPVLLFLGWALIDITPLRFGTAKLARRIAAFGVAYLAVAVGVTAVWTMRYRAYRAPPPYALPQTLANGITRLYRETYGEPLQFAAGTFPLPYDLAFYSIDHPHGIYGLDLSQSSWIDARSLKAGNKVVVCGTLRFEIPSDPNCILGAQALFGIPDRVKRIEYEVCDPKSKHLGRQSYDVLMWKPHISNENVGR